MGRVRLLGIHKEVQEAQRSKKTVSARQMVRRAGVKRPLLPGGAASGHPNSRTNWRAARRLSEYSPFVAVSRCGQRIYSN